MNLYEKYKDDLEAQNFICFLESDTNSTEEEIEDAIVKIRKIMNLQDALQIFRGIYGYTTNLEEINKLSK